MKLMAMLATDGYKLSHKNQYPVGTERVYSTWTPRSNKHLPQVESAVALHQGALKEVNELFQNEFFSKPKEEIVAEYKRQIGAYLFNPNVETSHIEALHDLGYLPLEVKALPEGTLVPMRVPMLTVENTVDEFFWLTNFVETIFSALLWKPITSASLARVYRQILDENAIETTGSNMGVEFQGHDFSMRGLSGPEDAARTGFGHLLSFVGTDTLPAIKYAEDYYGADVTKELVGCSVAATEHSVMCSGSKEGEADTYKRLITELYPTGIVSIVSDTWDLWNVMTNIIPNLKDEILARDGGEGSIDKVVIRPDSGDPADILCGSIKVEQVQHHDDITYTINRKQKMSDEGYHDGNIYVRFNGQVLRVGYDYNEDSDGFLDKIIAEKVTLLPEQKGVIELLWETFGGTTTEQGYKVLNPSVGAIYGDAITIDRCKEICNRLKAKGFATTNVVFGIGSYTYQYQTRDSLGFAMKATSVTINGEERAIFKDPITDDGTKKSAKGRVGVHEGEHGKLYYTDDNNQYGSGDLLTTVFKDGKFLKESTLAEIRERLK